MQDMFDDDERTEVLVKIKDAAQALLDTAMQLNNRLVDTGDVADISNDAYCDLVDMLKKLSNDYDISCMAADALVD
jgi:hypothetical protein